MKRAGGVRTTATQRGQATTEFVVVALALVPLFLLVVHLGKVIDLLHAAESASRYAAFEAVVRHSGNGWKSNTSLATEVRRRFFSHPDAPVKTNDVAGDSSAHRNPLWSNAAGHPLLPRLEDDVGVALHIQAFDTIPAAGFAGALGLSHDNLASAIVTVRPASVARLAPFDTLRLDITRRTVLLADTWTARDPTQVRARIESAPMLYPLASWRALVDVAGALPMLVLDPPLHAGEFDWDAVPCDRLVGGC
jgi:hypothetical protein